MAKSNLYAIISDLQNTELSLTELAAKHELTPQRIQQVYRDARFWGIKIPKRVSGGLGVPKKKRQPA